MRAAAAFLALAGCGVSVAAVEVTSSPSAVVIRTPLAEFRLLPEGCVHASVVVKGELRTVDEPGGPGDYLVSGGSQVRDFRLDLAGAAIKPARGKLGEGKRVEVTGVSAAPCIRKTIAIEVYDAFPNLAIETVAYRNDGKGEVPLEAAFLQRHRVGAPALWSFQGASNEWGQHEVAPVTAGLHGTNHVGAEGPEGVGGGIPVVDFWSAHAGLAIGHLETVPLTLSLPIQAADDGRVEAAIRIDLNRVLKPGETWASPRTFVAAHTGDFYEPLSLWSQTLRRENWRPAAPNHADYAVNWCGWGYEEDFTPAQMLATLPKLQDLGIRWTTLDYRWFDSYGDWTPRSDTFPGNAIREVVKEYHRRGMLMQLWWQPLAVEDGTGKHALPKPTTVSKLVLEHPDWVILNPDGRRARLISPVSTTAVLCPALPEVQDYHRRLVERFIRDWDYDGNKMDSVFSVPPCYNPKHHHKSPQDSVNAVADVYRIILETTRALKPESVTQICPCGTTPNLAWLPYQDQAVTADPLGSTQIRWRTKMYKALLGPRAAVYGDHVELSGDRDKEWNEGGSDFASIVGTGAVVGTRFTWPAEPPNPKFEKVALTPERDKLWKRWIDIYNAHMLSSGVFRNLYTIGFDAPEGYAIEKDGAMYYAFFAKRWKGALALRGLGPGVHTVVDYASGRELGTVNGSRPELEAEFSGSLLIRASRR